MPRRAPAATAARRPTRTPARTTTTTRHWVRREQVAEHLGVVLRTVDNLIAHGVIKTYQLPGNRCLLIDLNEVDAAVEAGAR